MKILYVINHVAFFVSHRLPIALEAQKNGHKVALLTGKGASPEMESAALKKLKEAKIKHFSVDFKSDGINPFSEFFSLVKVIQEIKKYAPDIIHSASPKGNLYAGLSAKFLKIKLLIISISGQGFIHTSSKKLGFMRKVLSFLTQGLFKVVFDNKNKKIIVQNEEDKEIIQNNYQVNEDEIYLIKGSGVDINQYQGIDISNKKNQILFPARVLFDKGAIEFFKAAEILKDEFPNWNFIVAGASDYASPSSVPREIIEKYTDSEIIQYTGHIDAMEELYKSSKIVCLPSYREGFPKAIMEASAAKCAVITSNVAGCRDAIINNVTGELVEPKNTDQLIKLIRKFILDENKIKTYGHNGHLHAKENFCQKKIVSNILNLYKYKNS